MGISRTPKNVKETRNAEVVAMRETGAKIREIATFYGVSNTRVRQIISMDHASPKRKAWGIDTNTNKAI